MLRIWDYDDRHLWSATSLEQLEHRYEVCKEMAEGPWLDGGGPFASVLPGRTANELEFFAAIYRGDEGLARTMLRRGCSQRERSERRE